MTTTNTIVTEVLTSRGFEVSEAPEFVESVVRLVEAGDREGLIIRIAVGSTYSEAEGAADEILCRVRDVSGVNNP